ncbi:MAG: alginate O-acetyltransferase AlgF, partial [Alphaproteobacteria bacterium]|nr:alginate O-acetyltransferase AlgF [Alphaproteobacteria bacterium]
FGEATHAFDVEEQKFYTVILRQDDKTLLVIEDDANTNQAKSQINFYNLSDVPSLSLKAKAGKISVIKDVEQGKAGFREINPVKIDLSVANGNEILFDAGDKTLERSETYSLFFVGKDDVVWVKSTTNTTK